MEIQEEEQKLLGSQGAKPTATMDTTDGPDNYENVSMDLTIPVEKPDYHEDEEHMGTHDYLEQKQAELEAKQERIEKVMKVRQRRAIDPEIQRRNFEHYEVTKVSTLNNHQYCMQMIQKYQDQLPQIRGSQKQNREEKTKWRKI